MSENCLFEIRHFAVIRVIRWTFGRSKAILWYHLNESDGSGVQFSSTQRVVPTSFVNRVIKRERAGGREGGEEKERERKRKRERERGERE